MAWVYGGLVAVGTVWIAAIAAAPLLLARGSRAAAWIYGAFAPICHQQPDRCFRLAGFPLAVCARCTGLYLGAYLALLVRPLLGPLTDVRFPSPRLFLILSLPIAVDASAGALGLWRSPAAVRFATGLLGGSTWPFYGLAAAAALFASRLGKKLE